MKVRRGGHVGATQIEQVPDVVQGVEHMGACLAFAHLRTHFVQFARRCLTRVLQVMGEDGLQRVVGAVQPDGVDQVVLGMHAHAFLLQQGLYVGQGLDHHGGAVKAQPRTIGQVFCQPMVPLRHIGFAEVNNIDTAARQLALGLQPVAAVGPDKGLVLHDHHGGDRGTEAREVLAHFPARRYIFGVVRVRGGQDPGVQVVQRHLGAQCGEALGNIGHKCGSSEIG